MFEKLGNKKYAVPLVVAIVIACVMSFMFYPMAHMEMKGLPFAVLSLDEGAETPQGTVNAGSSIVKNMMSATEGAGDDSPIAWVEVSSREELDAALEKGEYYGAMIVPDDFTEKQLVTKQAESQALIAQAQALQARQAQVAAASSLGQAAGVGQGSSALAGQAQNAGSAGLATAGEQVVEESPTVQEPLLQVIIDNAKSPLVASQMKTSMTTMFRQMGVGVEVETIHAGVSDASEGTTSASSPLSGMMSLQLTVAPLFVMSMMGALVLSRIFSKKRDVSSAMRWKSLAMQAVYAVAASLVASLCVCAMLTWVAGIESPVVDFVLFAWFASYCVMLLFLGLFNLSFGLGALVAAIAMAGGTMVGALPFEALPVFWQDWLYPWVPQRFVSEGLRAILYLGSGAWNSGSGPLAIIGVVGAALGCIAALLPKRESPADNKHSERLAV